MSILFTSTNAHLLTHIAVCKQILFPCKTNVNLALNKCQLFPDCGRERKGDLTRERLWTGKQRRRPSSAAQGFFITRSECLICLIGWAFTGDEQRPSVPCHFLSLRDGCCDLQQCPLLAAGK